MKALEERGIGRPSTYASIMGTILDRGYVWKSGSALVPSFLAFAVVTLLEQHFGELVDYDFTARMEEVLDASPTVRRQRLDTLRRFYFGEDGAGPGHPWSARPDRRATGSAGCTRWSATSARSTRARSTRSRSATGIVLRVGRYGPYLERERPRRGRRPSRPSARRCPRTSPPTS